uniref:HIG1 domain-containing protein n=1 Tax=Romanomermis culicivorax TaxID=13658 RepID=A0A915JKR8_ROMCU
MADGQTSIPIDKSKMKWIEKPIIPTVSDQKAAELYEETPELNIPGFKVSSSNTDLSSKRWQKFKGNPLVPLGVLCTAGAICVGLHSMYKGARRRSQLMMRFRVGFQAFTLVCICASMYKAGLLSSEKILANSSIEEPPEAQNSKE